MASFDSNFSAILALVGGGGGTLAIVLSNGNTTGDESIIVSDPGSNPNARIQGEDSAIANAGDLILRGGDATAGNFDGGDLTLTAGLGSGAGSDGIVSIVGNTTVSNGNFDSPLIRYGSGSPEGAVTAPVGATYKRVDGTAGTTLYTKVSGAGNTGWVPVGVLVTDNFNAPGGSAIFNTTRPMTHLPGSGVEPKVYINGVRQREGVGNDYVITLPTTLTFVVTPLLGDVILVDYLPAD